VPNLDEIIAEAKRTLSCPACGRHYEDTEIKLRGYLDDAYIIQTVCSNGHPPLITMFVASAGSIHPMSPLGSNHNKKAHITFDDALKAHEQIEKFNGQFSKVWNN